MTKYVVLWLATAAASILLSVFVPRVEPEAPVACRSTPVGQGFAWADGGHFICPFTPAAAPLKP